PAGSRSGRRCSATGSRRSRGRARSTSARTCGTSSRSTSASAGTAAVGVRRLEHIPGFNIDRVAAAADDDPDVLRLENLDTDIPPPAEAVEARCAAVGTDAPTSGLPFTGRDDLKQAVAASIERRGGPRYDGAREIVITSGEGDAMLDALL